MAEHRQLRYLPQQRPPFEQLSALLLLDRLVRVARPQPSSLLDVGCGKGLLLRLALRFFPGTRMTGVDPQAALLAAASDNARHAVFLRATPHALPLPAATVDVVTCRQHTPSSRWDLDLGEVRRVLVPGGLFGVAGVAAPVTPAGLAAAGFATVDTQFLPAAADQPGITVLIARVVPYPAMSTE